MQIEVIEDDIRKPSITKRSGTCPIARAIQRKTGDIDAYVGPYNAYICGDVFELPEEAIIFVNRYDNGKEVSPFKFNLERNSES